MSEKTVAEAREALYRYRRAGTHPSPYLEGECDMVWLKESGGEERK